MQKQIKILLTLLTVLILSISCANNNPNNPNEQNNNNQTVTPSWKENINFKTLANIWQGTDAVWTGEIYEIKDNGDKGVEFFAYGGGYGIVSYSITVEEIVWTSDTEGVMYGQYTESWDATSIGKYYAVAFKNLSSSTISISGAADYINNIWVADSLEQAKEIFTIEKGSFSEYTACVPYTGNK